MKSGKVHQKSKNGSSSKHDIFRVVKIVGVSVLFLSFLLMLLSVGLLFFVQAKLNMPVKTIAERQEEAVKHVSINGWKEYKNTSVPITLLIPPDWKVSDIVTTDAAGENIILSGRGGKISLSFGKEIDSKIDCISSTVAKLRLDKRSAHVCYEKTSFYAIEYILIGNTIKHDPESNDYKEVIIDNRFTTFLPFVIRADVGLEKNSKTQEENRKIILRILSTLSFN